MKAKVVRTSDLVRLVHAVDQLQTRGGGEEGMGLLHGEPGTGKTTAICYAVNMKRGVFVRAKVTWSVTSMLATLCAELGLPEHRHRHVMMTAIEESLALDPRPVFVDEADYLLRSQGGRTEMLDCLRDVYDITRCPVVLIGMEEIDQTMRTQKRYARFDRRLTERVAFQGLTVADAQRVAGELCEVDVEGAMGEGDRPGSVPAAGTLVEALHKEVRGNVGYLVRRLAEVERWAQTNGLGSVTLADWQGRNRRPVAAGVAA